MAHHFISTKKFFYSSKKNIFSLSINTNYNELFQRTYPSIDSKVQKEHWLSGKVLSKLMEKIYEDDDDDDDRPKKLVLGKWKKQ
jgi:hypothetical protein